MKNKLSIFLLISFIGILAISFVPTRSPNGFDLELFGRFPVVNGGRIKPLDSVARSSLLLLSGKQSFVHKGKTISAIHWLVDVIFQPEIADQYPVFTIDNPDVVGLLQIQKPNQRRFAYADIQGSLSELESQGTRIDGIKAELRSPFQRAVINLLSQINLYQKLENSIQLVGTKQSTESFIKLQDLYKRISAQMAGHVKQGHHEMTPDFQALSDVIQHYRMLDQFSEFFSLPPRDDMDQWNTMGQGVLAALQSGEWHPGVWAYAQMGDFYRNNDGQQFNKVAHDYDAWLDHLPSSALGTSRVEVVFNRVQPFYLCLVFYLTIFLLIAFGWLFQKQNLLQSTYSLLLFVFLVHTVALVMRMIIQARPPVTNLYSSAIFVGWVAIILGIVLEYFYRNQFGTLVSSVIGFLTLLVAHHLANQGDTLEMMRAVLDSNFWLATHVVTVTIGYGSTFLSGFIAMIFILQRIFFPTSTKSNDRSLVNMVFGVVCFATLFSFIGTVLGGIWADQSWGRFWGWDPKENGALMIVLWNVAILHARLGGYIKDRGLMVMAVFGNVVTSLSWFGVNMLGIGLHSYGFMDKAFWWLSFFVASQFILMGLGLYYKQPGQQPK